MKKISTGYLTPQANRNKKTPNIRRSESSENVTNEIIITDDLFKKIVSDPIKKNLILQILHENRDQIEEYKRNEARNKVTSKNNGSPLRKVNRRFQCESPTALLRRRALEKQARENESESSSERSESRQSKNSDSSSSVSPAPSPVPYDSLLDGVVAYVEVNSKHQDRSAGAKAVLRSMGAIVREQFTKGVTHVIFKDGLFSTFQKAKLLKIHLVSVLWLEAVKRSNCRVPEKNYPALGTEDYDNNVSTVCSQMQKEYEDVIRDEIRRSLDAGTPLPTTKSLIENRRRTTSKMSTSAAAFQLTQDIFSSQANDTSKSRKNLHSLTTDDLTSDSSSECGGIIDGNVTKYRDKLILTPVKSKNPANDISTNETINISSEMDLTDLLGVEIDDDSSELLISNLHQSKKNKRQSNRHSKNVSSDKTRLTVKNESPFKKPTMTTKDRKTCRTSIDSSTLNSSKSTNISDESILKQLSKSKANVTNSSKSDMSSLKLNISEEHLQILSKNVCDIVNSEKPSASTKSNMSSLQVSTSTDENKETSAISSNLSSLRVSSPGNSKLSFSPIDGQIINKVLGVLESPVDNNVTKRRRRRTITHIETSNTAVTYDDKKSSNNSTRIKRVRKLYDPDESIMSVIPNDDEERNIKRTEVKNRKSITPVVVNVTPNIMLTAKAKRFIDDHKINVESVLNNYDLTNNKKIAQLEEKKVASPVKKLKNFTPEKITRRKSARILESKSEGNIRKSVRLSQLPKKKTLYFNSESENESEGIPIRPMPRRSSIEFQNSQKIIKNVRINANKQKCLVFTKMHREDILLCNQIVKKLGGFHVEDEVSTKTTHLVAGEPKRTINMLRAMSMGCWVLRKEWILKSLEERKWLPEEDFEEINFSPAVQQCRLQRQAFGSSFSMDIFNNCGLIYIARSAIPRCSDLIELVKLCKGHIVRIPKNADVIVGEYIEEQDVTCVKETWILDSITFNKTMRFKKYLLNNSTSTSQLAA